MSQVTASTGIVMVKYWDKHKKIRTDWRHLHGRHTDCNAGIFVIELNTKENLFQQDMFSKYGEGQVDLTSKMYVRNV